MTMKMKVTLTLILKSRKETEQEDFSHEEEKELQPSGGNFNQSKDCETKWNKSDSKNTFNSYNNKTSWCKS